VYEFLLKEGGGVPVAEIGTKLLIAPADIYRLIKPLSEAGLIKRSPNYPATLAAIEPCEALSLFLLAQSRWFNEQFKSPTKVVNSQKSAGRNTGMQLEFIQGRDELMRVSVDEMAKTTKSVDLLRSGHEIPADLLLEMTRAIGRNVKIRMIIQDHGPENKEMVENWVKNGILVRRTNLKSLRLMIYDSKVGYFMSYKHSDSGRDMGMKIVYPAFAAILSRYFEDLWQEAEKI
jgi:sugar-specific transcriptional regulator TrmB